MVVGIFIAPLTSVLVGDESELLLMNREDLAEKLEEMSYQLKALAEKVGVEPPEETNGG